MHGEKRWISELNEETTCGQLVEALLQDEGINVAHTDPLNQYVISEKWRRVEQILNSSTKVLKIWTAWGEAQSEVKCSISAQYCCFMHLNVYIHTRFKIILCLRGLDV